MITPAFLKSCTDEQINKGVAWRLIKSRQLSGVCSAQSEIDHSFSQNLAKDVDYGLFNPCTNPNDAWPIMMNNLISTTPRGRSSYAQPYASSGMLAIMVHCDSNEELLRAAMEVYILMSTQS